MPVSALILGRSDVFAGCPAAALTWAASRMELLPLRKREVLVLRGQTPPGLGVVVQGSVQMLELTQDGREVAVQSAAEGEVLGLEGLLAPRVEPVSWVAASGAATVAAMTREDALALLEMEGMGLRAARWLARKLAETWAWNRLVGVHPVMARVCACLLWLKKEDGTLALPTHAELGWRLNTTRESVTRALQRL
ncbi:Crp/Fnr family transcriptional regulator, partial [Tepidimonas sp.]|uniref:Crp/Fnr family transcriptional regulator n=1 Tax=Tepidimonas sp. TaxID=2002775 RepID=UPI00391967DD